MYNSISKNDVDNIISVLNDYAKPDNRTYNKTRKDALVNYINDVLLSTQEMYQTAQATNRTPPSMDMQTLPTPKISVDFPTKQ